MIGKLVRLFLLFCLGMIIISAVLLQTDFVQKKIVSWVEKKTEGALTIGKLEGIIPFWIRLRDVTYKTDELDISIDQARLTLSPGSLLLGHLSILNLHIDHANVQSTGDQWPQYPFPNSHPLPSDQSFNIQRL